MPFNIGEMYSGLMPIDANDLTRALFFLFQPTIGAPTDTLTIWVRTLILMQRELQLTNATA